MESYVLGLGTILLLAGIIVGIATKVKERRHFAIWVTIIGVGFTIAGIIMATIK